MKKYKIDVYIVDDHSMFNEGLTEAINHSDMVHVSHTFNTLAECSAMMAERRPDVLLLDISLPDGNSTEFCQWVLQEYSKVKILAVTIHDEYSTVQRMLDSGVHGYILKSSPIEELLNAIVSVWKGQQYISREVEDIIRQGKQNAVVLTLVEKNILRLICEGCTNPEIANQLHLSTETINWYRKRLLAKFDVKNTVSLVSLVLKRRILN